MNTKLTLTIEKEVIELAKKYAKLNGQSLSDLVENYFKLLTNFKKKEEAEEVSSRVKKLRGIIKYEDQLDYKELLAQELSEKYGS